MSAPASPSIPPRIGDPALTKALRKAFIEHGVLLFPRIGTSPDVHVALSRCFGTLQVHPVNKNQVEGFPEVVDMSYTPPTRPGDLSYHAVYRIEGRELAGWLPWHFDLSYMTEINHGSMLRRAGSTARGRAHRLHGPHPPVRSPAR
jgi:taurine dioxygenase